MSRGLGTRQQMILAELGKRAAFYLRDLLGETCTKAEYNAMLRAAMKLEDSGLIKAHRFMCGGNKLVVYRVGTTFGGDDRRRLDGLDVVSVG